MQPVKPAALLCAIVALVAAPAHAESEPPGPLQEAAAPAMRVGLIAGVSGGGDEVFVSVTRKFMRLSIARQSSLANLLCTVIALASQQNIPPDAKGTTAEFGVAMCTFSIAGTENPLGVTTFLPPDGHASTQWAVWYLLGKK